jgi:hypothetical protein
VTPAAQESFKQRRKFKSVKKNAKRFSKQGSKKGDASSSGPAKKGKSGAVHMITSFEDEGSTERASKKTRLASDIDDADQSADDESDNDLAGAASSSKQGGVKSRGKREFQTFTMLIFAVSMSTQVLSKRRRSLHLRQSLLLSSTRRCLAKNLPRQGGGNLL